MKRAERLHAISQRIRRSSPGLVSASTLAEEFGVSRRTIERDLESLRASGVPLYSAMGRRGGAGSLERGGARTVVLDEAQIVGLLVALHGAGGAPYDHAATSAVGELTDALDDAGRVALAQLCERIRVTANAMQGSDRVKSVLEDAVKDQRVVNLRYVDRHGVETRRSVDPVAFLGVDGRWALIGWCHLRSAGRLFRLDRIAMATATRRPATAHDVDHALGWVPHELRSIR